MLFNEILEITVLGTIAIELFALYRHAKLEKRVEEHIIVFDKHTNQFDDHINRTGEYIVQLDKHITEINKQIIELNNRLSKTSEKTE